MTAKKNGSNTDFHQLGRKNRAEGKSFEERIQASFDYYKAAGTAQVDKTPEPVKFIKRLSGGRFEAAPDRKAQPDYKGTLKGGRSLIFEAKFTSGDKIEDSRVTEIQWRYLDQASKLGAYCYVIAGFGTGNVYKIPWEIWSSMKEYFGRKYVTEKDLRQYQVKVAWNGMLMLIG